MIQSRTFTVRTERKTCEKKLLQAAVARDSSGVYIEIRDAIWGRLGQRITFQEEFAPRKRKTGVDRWFAREFEYVRRSFLVMLGSKGERGRRAREIETRGRVARARARDHESIAAIR